MWRIGNTKVVVTDMKRSTNIKSAVLTPVTASGSIVHFFGYGSDELSFNVLVAGNQKLNEIRSYAYSGTPVTIIGPLSNPVYSGSIFITNVNIDAETVVCQTWDPEVPSTTVVYRLTVEGIEQ